MPLTRDSDETVTARARRDPEFRDGVLRAAAEALLLGEADVGTALAGLASATNGELLKFLLDAEAMAVIGQRLADTPLSESIPHAQVEPEMRE